MKVYARQIAPESQVSPLEYIPGEYWEEEYFITGNSQYTEYVNRHFSAMTEYLADVQDDIGELEKDEQTDAGMIETVKNYFHKSTTPRPLKLQNTWPQQTTTNRI